MTTAQNPFESERTSELNQRAAELEAGPINTDDDMPSSQEVVDSMTGFDEQAIEKAFGRSLEDLAEHTGATFLRALVFTIERRREGASDAEAYKVAQGMRFGELKTQFRKADGDEDDADLPGSPVGEGNG